MKRVVIIANGEFPKNEYPRMLIQEADIIVCCDGATDKYLEAMPDIFSEERLPDIIIGDLDSISEKSRDKISTKLIHVKEQDTNDQTKAFDYVMHNISDIESISILAATGLREDHSIANMGLLMEYGKRYNLRDIELKMVSDYSNIIAIHDSTSLFVGRDRRISIISPDNSLNIISKGLQWQTKDVIFDNWWQATLNKSCEDMIELQLNHPAPVLLIMD